jgi:hypothetical protein
MTDTMYFFIGFFFFFASIIAYMVVLVMWVCEEVISRIDTKMSLLDATDKKSSNGDCGDSNAV